MLTTLTTVVVVAIFGVPATYVLWDMIFDDIKKFVKRKRNE